MLTRRGFTLVELLVVVVLLGIVGLATSKITRTMMVATTAQIEVANAQSNARVGVLAIPQELREIGYDTVPVTGATASDLESIAANRLTIRASRGMGITCGTPTLTEFRLRKPLAGVRQPRLSDTFLLFVESDPNLAADDEWATMLVSAIDFSSTCGADSAIRITLSATPIFNPTTSAPIAISQIFVGGPVKWFERVEYGPVIDATTNQAFVGTRSLSLGETNLTPAIGPMPDTSSFSFIYYASDGTVLTPGVSLPINVRSIGLNLTAITEDVGSLAGSTKRATTSIPVTTRVALRNAIRP